MPYSFQGITTMSSALRAYQAELDVTGNNISNSETAGYSRQTVALTPAPNTTELTIGGGAVSFGTGVSLAAVSRVRDMFLTGTRASAESKLGRQQEALTGVTNVQSAMGEPTDGVSAAYDAFNSAWTALSASPGDASAKSDVQSAAQSLVTKINTLGQSLQSQKSDNATNTTQILGKIDADTAKIASLNAQISTATAQGGSPNDLLDERDQTLQDLAGYADVTATTANNGIMNVSLNGLQLVAASGAKTISDKYDSSTGRIVQGNTSYAVNGGSLAGAHDTDVAIDSASTQLDTFANNLRSGVNALYTTGKTSDGTTGASFFAEPTAPATTTNALSLSLSSTVAGDASTITAGTSGLSGDGTLATQIAALGTTKVSALGNQSMSGYYASFVSGVGGQVSTTSNSVDTQTSVVSQIDAQISSTSGVSMDDEMANLLRFQRSYQAAAKALTTFDSVTGTLIDMLER